MNRKKYYVGIFEDVIGLCFSSECDPVDHYNFLYFSKVKIIDYIKLNSANFRNSSAREEFQDSIEVNLEEGTWKLGDQEFNNSLAIKTHEVEELVGEDDDSAKLYFRLNYSNLKIR